MSSRNQGILYIIAAGFFFSLMTFFVRLSGDLPTMQKAFFRNAVATVAAAVILAKSADGFKMKKQSRFALWMRCAFGTTGIICNFYAIDKISLADSNILNKLSPFFAIIASLFILKEKADRYEWGTVIVAFTGALFVVKPSFQMEFLYGIIGVMGGLCAGIAYTWVRKLGTMGERGPIIVMYFSLFSCITILPFMILTYEPMTWKQLGILLLAGASATGGQLCITKAYTKAPAKEISVFDYSQVIFAAILGMCFLGQVPDALSIAGYVIIIGSAVFKWLHAWKHAEQ